MNEIKSPPKAISPQEVEEKLAACMNFITQEFGGAVVATLVVRPGAAIPNGVIASNDPDLEVVREMLLNYRRHLASANRTNGK